MSVQEDNAHVSTAAALTLHRAVNVVMGSAGIYDRADAEELLAGLARRLDRPMIAVAEDVASGCDFPGRPGWL